MLKLKHCLYMFVFVYESEPKQTSVNKELISIYDVWHSYSGKICLDSLLCLFIIIICYRKESFYHGK